MPHHTRKGRYWNNPGKSFVVIGNPPEPAIPEGEPLLASDLVDPEDPALFYIFRVAEELRRYGFDVKDPEIAARAIDAGRKRHEENRALDIADPPIIPVPPRPEVVYYMRIGNRVKIGTSTSLETRLAALNPEELMVTEDGGYTLERLRHRQFKELRTHGEWFKLEDPLTGHIEMLRQIQREAS